MAILLLLGSGGPVGLAGMIVMLIVSGFSEDYTVAIVFGVLTLASVLMAVILFKNLSTA